MLLIKLHGTNLFFKKVKPEHSESRSPVSRFLIEFAAIAPKNCFVTNKTAADANSL